jgi:hypothetical protein
VYRRSGTYAALGIEARGGPALARAASRHWRLPAEVIGSLLAGSSLHLLIKSYRLSDAHSLQFY